MKTVFILALLPLAASSTFAQLDTCSQGYEEQWQQQLNPCRDFLRQQCSSVTVPWVRSLMWQLRSCQVMQQRCCQQLKQMAQQSRCQAICSMAQAIMQQGEFYEPQQALRSEMMRMALNLKSMCNVYPNYCTTPCSIATGSCY